MASDHSHALLMMILAVTLVATGTPAGAESCNKVDQDAVLLIKEHLGNPSELSSWVVATDCCSWEGIKYCNAQGRVASVYLKNIDAVEGSDIASQIGDLTSLESLVIDNIPNLGGVIPSTITQLTNLVNLSISNTGVSGSIPDNLGDMSNLEELYFNDNKLEGTIPSSLGNLLSLSILDLHNNELKGSIPESVGNLKLTVVDLSQNYFFAGASFLLGEEKPTIKLNISHNKFIFNMSEVAFPLGLTVLDVSYNLAFDRLPIQLTRLDNLYSFNVSHNLLWGKIPQSEKINAFDKSAFDPNFCLCGYPLHPCPCCKCTHEKSSASKTICAPCYNNVGGGTITQPTASVMTTTLQ